MRLPISKIPVAATVLDFDHILGTLRGKFVRVPPSFLGGAGSGGGGAPMPATWGGILGSISSQADLAAALQAKQDALPVGQASQYLRGDGVLADLTRVAVGLANADNTSDAEKPVSAAQATALALKASLVSPAFTGAPTAPTAALGTDTDQVATMKALKAAVSAIPAPAPSFGVASSVNVTATARTLTAADSGKYLRFTDAGVKTVTVNASATEIEVNIRNVGAGLLTLVPASGVTLNRSAFGDLTVVQGAIATVKWVGANEYDVIG